jgi:uncharacterized membrane protein YfcA
VNLEESSQEFQFADSSAIVHTLVTRYAGIWAFIWGMCIAILGGLIGLGGAEFRLPVLLSFFRIRAAPAVIINLTTSLVTVTFSLIFRGGLGYLRYAVPHLPVVLNLLCGALVGSYVGSHIASRMREGVLMRVIALCLVALSFTLIAHDFIFQIEAANIPPILLIVLGIFAGFVIGLFSSILGVAGGELLIPTLVLLFGVEIKLAGSLSLLISLPSMMLGLWRYSRFPQFHEAKRYVSLSVFLATGSIIGALLGSLALQHVSGALLTVLLGVILLASAVRLFTHRPAHT